MSRPPAPSYAYAPHYCEENIWHLIAREDFAPRRALSDVAIVSNARRQCPIWSQRASLVYGNPVVWDYHVVMIERLLKPERRALVWDFDSLLALPATFDRWWETSFPFVENLTESYRPMFRLLSAEEYLEILSSDRRHMRDEHGRWRMPPPSWAPILQGDPTLSDLIDVSRSGPGEVLDHGELVSRFSSESL